MIFRPSTPVFFFSHMKRLQGSLRQMYHEYTGHASRMHAPVVCSFRVAAYSSLLTFL